jgi:hypothetical protein
MRDDRGYRQQYIAQRRSRGPATRIATVQYKKTEARGLRFVNAARETAYSFLSLSPPGRVWGCWPGLVAGAYGFGGNCCCGCCGIIPGRGAVVGA